MLLMARSALNLYECAVSISNADSTLQIVKEQQPIFADLKLVNLSERYSLRFTN